MKPYWLDEVERMNRMLRMVMESSTAKLIRDMQWRRQLLEPPGYSALLEWQDKAIPQSLRINDGLTAGFSSLVGQYDMLKSLATAQYPKYLAADLQRSLRIYRPPALPVIEAFSSSLVAATRNLEALHAFENTFAGQLLRLARDITEASDDEVSDRVIGLTELLENQIRKSSRGPISIEGWVQIILALVLYFSNMLSAQRLEERLVGRFQAIETQIKAIAPTEEVKRAPELRLVSANVLRMRAEPNTEAQVIGKLTRNSLVRVLDEQRAWARVEYFDFVAGETKDAWVAKQYLRVLPNKLVE